MTSATDELRRMLDERGIEYSTFNDFLTHVSLDDRVITFFSADDDDVNAGRMFVTVDYPKMPADDGAIWLTPEQAVESALGRGTCKHMRTFNLVKRECDGEYYEWHGDRLPSFCPNCGAEVTR